MTTLDVDRATRAQGITLGALRAALPPDVFERSPRQAWGALLRSFACIAAGEALLALLPLSPGPGLLWRVPALLALWALVAAGMVSAFVIGHDCGHMSFSRRRWVNVLVGHLCMSFVLTSFHAWRIGHNHHHARTQLRGEDTDWPEQMVTRAEYARLSRRERLKAWLAYGSPAGLLLGFLVTLTRRTFMATFYPQVPLSPRARRQVWTSNAITLSAFSGLVAGLVAAGGVVHLVKHFLAPFYLASVLGGLFTYLHHTGEGALVFDRQAWTPLRGQVVSTFDVRFPRWFEALFLHINRHLPHHIAPNVPWYHLPRATDALRAAFPDCYQERRFSLAYLLRGWRAPLLEPIDDGLYTMSPRVP